MVVVHEGILYLCISCEWMKVVCGLGDDSGWWLWGWVVVLGVVVRDGGGWWLWGDDNSWWLWGVCVGLMLGGGCGRIMVGGGFWEDDGGLWLWGDDG